MMSMKRSAEKRAARISVSMCSGGSSIASASRSLLTSTATVPAFTRKTNSEPPTPTTPTASRKAVSTTGCDNSAATVVAAMSRHSSDMRATGSVPRTSATRKMPPTMGMATTTLNTVSAIAWMSVTGQLAAAMRAPRFNTDFNRSRYDMGLVERQ